MDTSLPRLRRLAVSVHTFKGFALGNALLLTLILITGATVRLTGSGLGCGHWPGCTAGDPFPSNGIHSFIEFGNRIVAAITVFVTLAAFLGALFLPSATRAVRWLAAAVFIGTF